MDRPLWLVECGSDDTPEQGKHFLELQRHCPDLHVLRLGEDGPVSEYVKQQALLASDLVLSLVDNIQETFGLSIAEAMAAGKPVVASNWDGYRDLVRDGLDGFLIPSRWDEQADVVSFPLAWTQKLEINSFPYVSGSLAQLVQVDLAAAEAAVLTLLTQPALARAMGRAARRRAIEQFSADRVLARFAELFEELACRRKTAEDETVLSPPVRLDPVRCFAGYASHDQPFHNQSLYGTELPEVLLQARQPFCDQLSRSLPDGAAFDWRQLMQRKHA